MPETLGATNWLGDVGVPIGILVISTLFTLWLARVNRTERRDAFLFQRDLQLADTFRRATKALRAETFLSVGDGPDRRTASEDLLDAASEFFGFVSGDPDEVLSSYIGERWNTIDNARKWAARLPPNSSSKLMLNTLHKKVDGALDEMRTVIRAWPFPERRTEILVTIHTWRVGQELIPPTDPRLEVDRLMLASAPSQHPVLQWFRALRVWFRGVRDDYRYERLAARLSRWRLHIKRSWPHPIERGAARRLERAEDHEQRYLRVLQEASRRHLAKKSSIRDAASKRSV